MSGANIGTSLVEHLGDEDFEQLCSRLAPDIAKRRLGIAGALPIAVMGRSHDGGIEAKAGRQGQRVVGIQAKAYGSAASEQSSIKKSLKRMLASVEHTDVTDFVWCSRGPGRTADTRRSADHDDLMLSLQKIVPSPRNVTVHYLSARDIEALLTPDLQTYLKTGAVLDSTIINRWSQRYIDAALHRIGGSHALGIEFASPLTAVLEDFSGARRFDDRKERIARIASQFRSRADRVPQEPDAIDVEKLARRAQDIVGSWLGGVPLKDAIGDADIVGELIAFARQAARSERGLSGPGSIGHQGAVLAQELFVARTLDEAIRTGFLIVSGAWGTGKTHHLAKLAGEQIAGGGTVLFIRARDLPSVTPTLFSGPVASISQPPVSERTLLLHLDRLGRGTRDSLVVIDGVNEWHCDHADMHVAQLRDAAAAYPHVRVVVSVRDDRPTDVWDEVTYIHRSPDVVSLSAAFESATGAFPGTAWRVALANPLLACVAALVAAGDSGAACSGNERFGILALLDRWTGIVAKEVRSRWPDISEASVRDVVRWVGDADAEAPLSRSAARARGSGAPTDRILDALVESGMLLDRADDLIQFRSQGFAQATRVRASVRRGWNEVGELLRSARAQDRFFLLDVLAEELLTQGTEICDLPDVCAVPPDDLRETFARALAHRHRSTETPRTAAHVRTALHSPDTAWRVLLAVLVNTGEGFDAAVRAETLVAELDELRIGPRSRIWPRAIDDLLSTDDDIDAVRRLVAGLHRRITDSTTMEDPVALGLLLTWLGCDRGRGGMGDTVARLLTELLHRCPEAAAAITRSVIAAGDDHRLEVVLSACHGVQARWPAEATSARVLRDVRSAAASIPARSWTASGLLNLLLDVDSNAVAEFLVATGAASRRRMGWSMMRRAASPWAISEFDADTFADGRSLRGTADIEDRIARELGFTRRERRRLRRHAVAELHGRSLRPHDEPSALGTDHAASLIRQRWLAEQYARYPRGASVIRNWQTVKAGEPENPGAMIASPLEDPAGFIDTSVPAALGMDRSEVVHRPESAPRLPRDAAIDGLCLDDLRVNVDGEPWLVLGGHFRYLDPVPASMAPAFRIGSKVIRGATPRVDGFPDAGKQRHEFLTIESRFAGAAARSEHEGRAPTWIEAMWAGPIRDAEHESAVLTPHDGPPLPTGSLLLLLGARWTGNGVDCRTADGQLIIKELDDSGPPAVLVHEERLRSALRSHARQILLRTRVANLHHRWTTPFEADLEIPSTDDAPDR